MKNLLIITISLLFLAGYSANAQMGQQKQQKKGMMMQKGAMMHGMMGQQNCPHCGQMMNQDMPMKKYMMMVNHLPMMQEQLSLEQNQTEQLIDLQTEFKKQQIDYQAELMKKKMQLKNLLNEDASADEVKSRMQECSQTKINMKIAAYETAREMKAVLNKDQMEKLENNMMMHGGMQGQRGMMQNRRGGMMQNRMNNQ